MATEYSAFDTMSQRSPESSAGTPLPPPAPGSSADAPDKPPPARLADARSPGVLPSLPPVTPRPSPVPDAAAADATASPLTSPEDAPDVPGSGSRRKKSGARLGWIVVVFAAAVVGITGYLVLVDDDSASAPTGTGTAVTVDEAPDSGDGGQAESGDADGSGNVIVDTFDDARDVVDQINENESEAELLDELGLGADGNPVAPVSPDPAGYRFTWSDPSGQDLDVTVDAATNDYSVVASDGISFRYVGGAFVGTDGTDEWYELAADPFGNVPVIGLGGIPSMETVLPASTAPFISSDTGGDIEGERTVVIDDAAFAAADSAARSEWLRPWGLLDETAEAASTVVVRISTDPATGVVTGARLESPALGGAATFAVTETYDVAPTIENPLTASS